MAVRTVAQINFFLLKSSYDPAKGGKPYHEIERADGADDLFGNFDVILLARAVQEIHKLLVLLARGWIQPDNFFGVYEGHAKSAECHNEGQECPPQVYPEEPGLEIAVCIPKQQ